MPVNSCTLCGFRQERQRELQLGSGCAGHDARVHRIGRTARAKNDGVAITFVSEKEQTNFHTIEKFLEKDIYKIPVPAELGEAPEYQLRNHDKGGRKRGGGGNGNKSHRGGKKRSGGKGAKPGKE